jgi:hypothetical protein
MEEEALEAVREANQELIEARLSVHRYTSGALDQHEESSAPAEEQDEDALASNVMLEEVGDIENGAEGQKGSLHGLRHRATSSVRNQWELAQSTAQEIQRSTGKATAKTGRLSSGISLQFLSPLGHVLSRGTKAVTKNASKLVRAGSHSGKSFRTVLEHPTYAVVTFTSRQAAIAARQCLADGGGLDRWVEIAELPVTPLADAPPRKIMFCRGFCRPVTLTISDNEKMCRKYM